MTERKCRKMFLVVLGAMLLAFLARMMVAYAAESSAIGCVAIVNADTKLNLREEPQGKIIGKLPRGESVTILSEQDRNGYYKVLVHRDNMECYAYGEYLTILHTNTSITNTSSNSTTVKPDNSNVYYEEKKSEWENATLIVVSDKKLNLRKKPSRKANRIKYLEDGDRLVVMSPEIKNNYILVKDLADGKVGYVDINYVVLESEYENSGCKTKCCENCTCW